MDKKEEETAKAKNFTTLRDVFLFFFVHLILKALYEKTNFNCLGLRSCYYFFYLFFFHVQSR